MFTGLIESVGAVESLTPTASGFRIAIRAAMTPELRLGESVAVNGVCLTVTGAASGLWFADVGPETVRVTTLGSLPAGTSVNLERSMPADGRFGGHLVQGHVDGVGTIEQVRQDGESHWMTVAYAAGLRPLFVLKGAVCLDGISLTVAGLAGPRFDVMVIPFTWTHTNLCDRRPGDRVNIECDLVGKYVARAVEIFGHASGTGG
jgi:riboflavin synthase